jgi:hypothetical protein
MILPATPISSSFNTSTVSPRALNKSLERKNHHCRLQPETPRPLSLPGYRRAMRVWRTFARLRGAPPTGSISADYHVKFGELEYDSVKVNGHAARELWQLPGPLRFGARCTCASPTPSWPTATAGRAAGAATWTRVGSTATGSLPIGFGGFCSRTRGEARRRYEFTGDVTGT